MGVKGGKMMFGYFQRSQWAWIATFYRMSKFNSVLKLFLENFVGSIINFLKNEILRYRYIYKIKIY